MFRRRGNEKTAKPVYQNLTKRKGGWMLRQRTFGWMRPGSLKRRRRHTSGGFSPAGSNTEGAGFETGPPREIVYGDTTPCQVTPVILHAVVSPETRLVAGAEGGCPEARIAEEAETAVGGLPSVSCTCCVTPRQLAARIGHTQDSQLYVTSKTVS